MRTVVLGMGFSVIMAFCGFAGTNDLDTGVAEEEISWDFDWDEPEPETDAPETDAPETEASTEPETEAPTEKETEPETEASTEPVSETEEETTASETVPESTPEGSSTEQTKKSGGSSSSNNRTWDPGDPNHGPGVETIVETIPETIVYYAPPETSVEVIPEIPYKSPIPNTGDLAGMFGVLKVIAAVLVVLGGGFAVQANRRK